MRTVFVQFAQCSGDYMNGHFMWKVWNQPLASFINFIWNDHECKILFIIQPFKMEFYRIQNEHYINKKMHCKHGHCQWRYVFLPYYRCGPTIFMTLSTE